jgi:methyl-accepting chemotaxis protein-2 (aspartate sensor receptor)
MASLVSKWRNASICVRLCLSNFLLVLIFVAIFIFGISRLISSMIEARGEAEVLEKTQLLVDLVNASDKDLRVRAAALGAGFQASLSGQFELGSETIDIKGKPTPALKLNGKALNLDFSPVDQFTQMTGAVATVFAKTGDDFVRVTTSLKTENGERAIGTLLDRNHPGYKSTLEGNSFLGLATLFGRPYITQYLPIKDAQGNVIGLSFIGVDFSNYLKELKASIRGLKIGKTGYFYVLDARAGPSYGNLIVHPSSEGKNLLAEKDVNGKEFIRQILEQKNGVISYPWANPGEDRVRQKITTFTYMPSWNWVIAGGTYVDEYTSEVSHLRNLFMLAGALLVPLISGLLYWMARRNVSQPLAQLCEASQLIAQGDLSCTLVVQKQDEIGRLIESINIMGAGLSAVIHSVRDGAKRIATASLEIEQRNNDMSSRTESQASELAMTAATMDLFGANVNISADNARQANELALKASTVAEQGGEVVAQVVDTMRGINEASRKIRDIIQVIDGIAFQTNILALNAAVEAARAGEQGRGFAVVASEVRSLAGRSAEAAREIKTLINASVERVEQGTAQVDQAGSTMTEVVSAIKRVTDIVAEISAASFEQNDGVLQVSGSISQMDKSTQQNAALAKEMAAAASSLKSQAQELVDVVAVFRLDADDEETPPSQERALVRLSPSSGR